MAAQKATIETLKREWRETIEIIPVRVFDQFEFTAQYGIYTVPTTILIDSHGRVAFVNAFALPASELWRQFSRVATPPANAVPPPELNEMGLRTPARLFQDMREELPCQS